MGDARNLGIAAALVVAGGCSFGVNFGETRFRCDSARDCAAGQVCAAGYCEAPAADGADGSPTPAPALADAGPTAGTETLTLRPIADAYVDASDPAGNHGSSDQLRVDSDPEVASYLRFDLDALEDLEERFIVESAALELYANSDQAAGCRVSIAEDSYWSEGSLTFANAPPSSDLLGSSGPVSAATWASVDIPAAHADDLKVVAITTDDVTELSLASREAGEHAPRLIITIAAP